MFASGSALRGPQGLLPLSNASSFHYKHCSLISAEPNVKTFFHVHSHNSTFPAAQGGDRSGPLHYLPAVAANPALWVT